MHGENMKLDKQIYTLMVVY